MKGVRRHHRLLRADAAQLARALRGAGRASRGEARVRRALPQELWSFYLSYCEAGFAERRIGDVQVLFAKPGGAS